MRRMRLGTIITVSGSHGASWLHPTSPRDGAFNIQRLIEGARTAEAAKLDFIFLADSLALQGISLEAQSRTANFGVRLEPLTALAAVSMLTRRVGLVATATTTYNEPFHVARKFASLDHISGGRAGWNLVTSSTETEAQNFGRSEHMPHAERYARANEFADVVMGLWDSWEDDAFVRDVANCRYFDPAKLHVLEHRGEHFRVRGPLNVARPPQGHPVVFQAGSSGPGMALAARTADCVFTAQPDAAKARAFYREMKDLARKAGRDPETLKVIMGFNPIVGPTQAMAEARLQEMEELVHPMVGLGLLSMALGVTIDPAVHPLDGPVPDLPLTNSSQSRQAMLVETARRENLTLRQLALRQVNGANHNFAVGTPSAVADKMEELFATEAADGFLLAPALIPLSLREFTDQVVPELQRRGLFRTEYEGTTLRENLGLPRPQVGIARRTAAPASA